MTFEEFEQSARAEWERIPDAYREGIDGLIIDRSTHYHPEKRDVYTLGECVTESWPSEFGGPDTTRSSVVLYYGSFRRLAAEDEHFDWDGELWETLTHELRHHLESLADDEALLDVDYAVDESFKRRDGEPFDPFYYRSGESLGPGLFRAEMELFVEVEVDRLPRTVEFAWADRRWRAEVPSSDADVCYVVLDDVAEAPQLMHLAIVRRRGLWQTLRALAGGRALTIEEVDGRAAAVGDWTGPAGSPTVTA